MAEGDGAERARLDRLLPAVAGGATNRDSAAFDGWRDPPPEQRILGQSRSDGRVAAAGQCSAHPRGEPVGRSGDGRGRSRSAALAYRSAHARRQRGSEVALVGGLDRERGGLGVSHLDRLADLYGIEPHYFDIWGDRHDTPSETKAAILKAMGLRTGSAAEISESLHATLERRWRRPLPPTIVATMGETIPATLTLRADVAGAAITWKISTETGTGLGGSIVPHELDLMETVELAGVRIERRRLSLPPVDETGYHTLHVLIEDEPATSHLIVCPSRCYSVADAVGEDRLWGLSLQLYWLRSDRDWGIGDFSDLARFATAASGFGASLIGVNPLHALFPAEPRHASPYSPSSREALNPLY